MNKRILSLALPNIITNITVPLVGMVDLAIVGHLGNEIYIGAIAIATMIFNMIYWNFGFLRMGTSGFTAQAYGANNFAESAKILVRALTIAFGIALLLIILQIPILKLSFLMMSENHEMQTLVYDYFAIRIWAAPATLGLYAIKGWFIGMQNSKIPMWIAIVLNIVNIVTSFFFAFELDMGIKGVALGTVTSQYSGLFLGIIILRLKHWKILKNVKISESLSGQELIRFFKVNADIFLRSLCLIIVFTFIPAESSKTGDMTLAVNTLLMQFFTLFSYIMDGFAYAGESLVGRFIGAKDKISLKDVIQKLFLWGIVLSVVFVGIYATFGKQLLWIFTNEPAVIDASNEYYFWVLIIPFSGFAAFLWDGIYIGATASKAMRNAMFISTGLFFAVYYPLSETLGNNALWIAFVVYLLTRGIMQSAFATKAIYSKTH